jgi:nitrite reductase/ring-hydroxylating ferredoxin subunit
MTSVCRIEVCQSAELVEGGDGIRFALPGKAALTAFAIRSAGQAYAYINRCAHVPVELDWMPGKFFDEGKEYLVCATHGASYAPHSGQCVGGPCRDRGLQKLPLIESNGVITVEFAPALLQSLS